MSQAGISSVSGIIGIPVMVSNGGTGKTSFIPFSVITGGTTSTNSLQSVASVGTLGQVLTSSGAGALPTWTTLPTPVTSVSGTANRINSTGGSTPVIDISASYVGQSSITTLGTITTGIWNGTTIGPTFGGTGQTTYATGDILYASAANTLSKLAAGSNTNVLTLASGVPTWAAPASTGISKVIGQLFTSSGAFTYTPTASMKYVIVQLVGGGGGSGGVAGAASTFGASGGGGGGAYAEFILTAAQVGVSLSGSVGAAGIAGTAGANNGGDGGNTTLATTSAWTAVGGKGGSGVTSNSSAIGVSGGVGGTVTVGTGTLLANIIGGSGGPGQAFLVSTFGYANGGLGGASRLSGSAINASTANFSGTITGNAGIAYGGGGGGSTSANSGNVAGATGSIGVAIFLEFS